MRRVKKEEKEECQSAFRPEAGEKVVACCFHGVCADDVIGRATPQESANSPGFVGLPKASPATMCLPGLVKHLRP